MKYNNLFLGLGVLAVALASCSEELEYTPAEGVATPPAYFSMNDEKDINLEETDTYFTFKVYRQNTEEAAQADVTLTAKTADGSPIAASLFKIVKMDENGNPIRIQATDSNGNPLYEDKLDANGVPMVDQDGNPIPDYDKPIYSGYEHQDIVIDSNNPVTLGVNFAKGKGEGLIMIDFGKVDNLVPTLDYEFDLKAAGEASPYYITSIDYTVAYVPWQTLDEPATIQDYALLAPAVGGSEIEWEVTVQEHPLKPGFFRIAQAYKDSPYSKFYVLDDDDLNYLYINATNPAAVYFSDSKGNPTIMYNTGIQNFSDTEGPVHFACSYSAYQLQTDITFEGVTDLIDWKNLDGTAGTYEKGRVKFGTNLYVFIPGVDGYWRSKSWTLVLPNAPEEWVDMGEATYTDGFIGEYFLDQAYTYKVRVQAHESEASKYRLIAPYASGTWPSEIAIAWPETFNLIIDASDPDFVLIEPQTIFEDGDGQILAANAAYAFQYMTKEPSTKEEIIADGLNDKMENGVITIAHPLIDVGNDTWKLLWTEKNWKTPAKIVLPTAEEQAQTAVKKAQSRTMKVTNPSIVRK